MKLTLQSNAVRESLGGSMRQHSGMNLKQYTLYNLAVETLNSKDFMREGGILGFYCQHAYAYTDQSPGDRLPYTLNGVNALSYSIFHHMDMDVTVKPVLDFEASQSNWSNTSTDEVGDQIDLVVKGDLVGTGLHEIKLANIGGYEGECSTEDIVLDSWKSEWHKETTWSVTWPPCRALPRQNVQFQIAQLTSLLKISRFNKPVHKEVASVHMAYGNDASLHWHYSSAAILVKIPKFGSQSRMKAA